MTLGKTKLDEVSRRGFLAGMMGLAAQGMVPRSVASALVQQLADPAAASDALERAAGDLLYAIRWRLEQFRSDKLRDRAVANIAGKLGMPTDQFEEFMEFYEYGSDPEQAARQLVQHLRGVDPRSISVRDRDFDDYDDDLESDGASASGADLSQAIDTAASTVGRGQAAAVTGAAASQFRDLVQRVMSAGQTSTAPGEPRVKDMGKIEPTSPLPALPAPDRSAADIMRDLQNIVDRPLTDQEKDIVQQELSGRQG